MRRDGTGALVLGEVPWDPTEEGWRGMRSGKGTEMPPACHVLPAHRPVHTGNGAPGKAAGHIPVHLVAQEVLPAPITQLEELVRVGGHAWGEGHRSGGCSVLPPLEEGALLQGEVVEGVPFTRSIPNLCSVPHSPQQHHRAGLLLQEPL